MTQRTSRYNLHNDEVWGDFQGGNTKTPAAVKINRLW